MRRHSIITVIAMIVAMVSIGAAHAGQTFTLAGAPPAPMEDVVAMDGIYSSSVVVAGVAAMDARQASNHKSVTEVSSALAGRLPEKLVINNGKPPHLPLATRACLDMGCGNVGSPIHNRIGAT